MAGDPYPDDWLPAGIRSRFVADVNGLDVHCLEAGDAGKPLLVLLHGFPELSFSWRKVMVPLAEAGYYVVAPDVRGYGRTTGWEAGYEVDLAPYGVLNLVEDVTALLRALGDRSVAAVIGHDFGSPLAAWCGLVRPDVFPAVAMMSAPFGGTSGGGDASIYAELGELPRPRKHYQRYYQTEVANADMHEAPQGLHAFLRGYYHYKSADWAGNEPYRLAARTATEWAKMPTYYIMDLDKGMAETVAEFMPTEEEIARNTWLPDSELAVYAHEFERTTFQGGLNHYRGFGGDPRLTERYVGRTLDQPTLFVSGKADWGTYQNPGALERMEAEACTDLRGMVLVDRAGHWVQQEQPGVTTAVLLDFLESLG